MSVKTALVDGWDAKDLTENNLPENDLPEWFKELSSSEEQLDCLLVEDEPPQDSQYLDDSDAQGQVSIQVEDADPQTFVFEIPNIPGADDQDDFLPEITVEEPKDEVKVEENKDPYSWVLADFPVWLMSMLKKIPRHTGKDVVGVERAMAFMEYLKKEISKAVRSDIKGELPIDELEKALEDIEKGIERLEERRDRLAEMKFPRGKKKKGELENNLVKEGKAAAFTVVVPLFISSMARTCINSAVSGGKDIDDCFAKVSKTYNLDQREQAELFQLLLDMNYPLRRPRGHLFNDEPIDTTSCDNLDWSAQYNA